MSAETPGYGADRPEMVSAVGKTVSDPAVQVAKKRRTDPQPDLTAGPASTAGQPLHAHSGAVQNTIITLSFLDSEESDSDDDSDTASTENGDDSDPDSEQGATVDHDEVSVSVFCIYCLLMCFLGYGSDAAQDSRSTRAERQQAESSAKARCTLSSAGFHQGGHNWAPQTQAQGEVL